MESRDAVSIIEEKRPEAIIVDPPRTGLSKKIIEKINSTPSIEKVVYVSCNPSTLARDINLFKEGNFKLKSVSMIDMFPQTYHIESIILLER